MVINLFMSGKILNSLSHNLEVSHFLTPLKGYPQKLRVNKLLKTYFSDILLIKLH